jgi:hypothetical protein
VGTMEGADWHMVSPPDVTHYGSAQQAGYENSRAQPEAGSKHSRAQQSAQRRMQFQTTP